MVFNLDFIFCKHVFVFAQTAKFLLLSWLFWIIYQCLVVINSFGLWTKAMSVFRGHRPAVIRPALQFIFNEYLILFLAAVHAGVDTVSTLLSADNSLCFCDIWAISQASMYQPTGTGFCSQSKGCPHHWSSSRSASNIISLGNC